MTRKWVTEPHPYRGGGEAKAKKNRPWLWIAVALALFSYHLHTIIGTDVPHGFHATPGANTVVLLSDQTCAYCKDAKRLLANAHVPYTEYDVEKSAKGREMYHRLHGMGVPILIINKQVIRGYDRGRILAALR